MTFPLVTNTSVDNNFDEVSKIPKYLHSSVTKYT